MPRSAIEKIGASWSLLIATMCGTFHPNEVLRRAGDAEREVDGGFTILPVWPT